jgi:hypothetical protein
MARPPGSANVSSGCPPVYARNQCVHADVKTLRRECPDHSAAKFAYRDSRKPIPQRLPPHFLILPPSPIRLKHAQIRYRRVHAHGLSDSSQASEAHFDPLRRATLDSNRQRQRRNPVASAVSRYSPRPSREKRTAPAHWSWFPRRVESAGRNTRIVAPSDKVALRIRQITSKARSGGGVHAQRQERESK